MQQMSLSNKDKIQVIQNKSIITQYVSTTTAFNAIGTGDSKLNEFRYIYQATELFIMLFGAVFYMTMTAQEQPVNRAIVYSPAIWPIQYATNTQLLYKFQLTPSDLYNGFQTYLSGFFRYYRDYY